MNNLFFPLTRQSSVSPFDSPPLSLFINFIIYPIKTMRRFLLLLLAIICLSGAKIFAQAPNLPTKQTLSETLLSTKSFTNSSQVDTVVKQRPLPDSYTLEVVAKVNSATGRGLDIEARNAGVKGFRLSLDASALKYTSQLSASKALTASNAGENHIVRIAVNNDSAHIYQNGAYIQSQPLSTIKDIVGGVESNQLINTVKGPTLIPNWAGTAPNNTGKPSDYGWGYTGTTNTTLFATANSTTAGTSRYMDVNASSGGNLHTLNGATYVGRLFYVRWDGNPIVNTVYNYPVTLEANTTYDFSMLHAYISNATGAKTITVGIGKTTATSGRIASRVFTTVGTRALNRENFVFTSQEAGTYYLTVTGNWGLFSIGELSLNKIDVNPRFIFGKNYPSGAVDMEISSVAYEDGAYAPTGIVTGPKQNVTVTSAVASYLPSFNTNFIVPGKTDIHLTGDYSPLINSSVELNSEDSWLFFDNIKPSDVTANWLDKVTINGLPASLNPNVRIAIYKNGTAVIPNGNLTSTKALEVFTQPNLAGDTQTYAIETYYDSLGDFNNKIRSFKLHRGYMATLANNPDGSGYSRVFIANDGDLIVNLMPQGLDTTVSFIRVFRWDWISKKGKAGWSPAKINATWYYDWNIAGAAAANYDYAIIRQNGGWPSWTDIKNKKNVNHLLGFNEPDRPDQSDMTVDEAFAQWPEMMKSGLRIGSPAPATPQNSWITNFLAKCDQMNYRVDFVAIHCYWGGLTPQQWYSQLKSIYDRVKRPLWITEWNNGANWTTESWPSDQQAQFEKQLNDIKGILQVLDTASFVERYAIYDWVENKRAMVLADTLTLAGKYYAANKSDFAYNPQKAYVHNWKLVAPILSSAINSDDYFKVTLSWKDLNGEMGSKYILERKVDGRDADFFPVQEFTDYTVGGNISYIDSVFAKATYRVKAFNKTGDQSVYSSTLDVLRDAAPVAPSSLTGEVLASSKIKLKWNAAANARSYNLKRSLSASGPFDTVSARTTTLEFLDENLTPSTTYYYVVTSLNSAGESANSTVLELRTKDLVAPSGVQNPRIASGDAKITLTWDFIYDAVYDVLRSETENGVYDTIASGVDSVRYEDKTTANGKTYYYKLVAHNPAGSSPETQVLKGKPVLGRHVYVSFNETTGTFAEDVWGGYHGTLAATAAHGTGYTAGALKLDGTATSYANLGEGLLTELNDFTIATWVKMDALSNWMRIFDFGTGTSNYMFLTAQANVSGGKSTIRYGIKNGGSEQAMTYAFAWPLNTWTHFAITQSGNTASLYINGELVASNNAVTLKPSNLGITKQNYIGKSQWNDPMLKGSIDEFKIFNRALSAFEVTEAMKEEQTITFNPITEKQVTDSDLDGGATASSGLPVTYTSSNEAVAAIVDGKIHITGRGVTDITATQTGNERYAGATAVTQQLKVYQLPTVKTKNIQVAVDANGNAPITPQQVDDGSVSYSGVLTLSLDKTNFTCSDIGSSITVILTAKDAEGRSNNATGEVTVVDDIKPTITVPADVIVNADNGSCSATNIALGSPVTSDNCGVQSVVSDALASFPVGTTDVTWTVTDVHGNITTAIQKVTVSDNQNPTITAPAAVSVSADNGNCSATGVALGTPVTDDNCGVQSITNNAPQIFSVGNTIVTWTVTDIHGNTATAQQTVTVTDNEKPAATAPSAQLFCYSNAGSYTVPSLAVSDNCGIASTTYNVSGATTRNGNGADASGSFSVGVSTITWTVTDVHGNVNTATTTITVNAAISATIPDVYAMNPAVDAKNTVYVGYGPSSLTITANATGGSAQYSYLWNGGQTSQAISVSNAGTYTVTVTDSKGCTTTASIVIKIINVECGNDRDKVMVCHNDKTICVASASVQSHLNHGDRLGSCESYVSASRVVAQPAEQENTATIVYPNPVKDQLTIRVGRLNNGAGIKLYNSKGALIVSKNLTTTTSTISLKGLAAGMYYVQVKNGEQITIQKIVKE
jgi:hypothetical protein